MTAPKGECLPGGQATSRCSFPTADGLVRAVQGLSYSLPLGRTLAIVGESGSGKSVSSMAIMGLHDPRSTRMTGSITVGGEEIVGMRRDELRKRRGADAAMIFQDPQSSLHPYFTVGDQIIEAYRAHHRVSKRAARERAVDMLGRVGIPNPRRRLDDYPHQFSGGMRQRAMIAMALVNDPKLLIADEPTTALDVTVQAQILDLIMDLQQDFGSAVVFITHDLGVVAEIADDVLVMYGGRGVEYGPAETILGTAAAPVHLGSAGEHPGGLRRAGPAAPDPGHAAEPARAAQRVLVPPALRVRATGCPATAARSTCPTWSPRTADPARTSRCHLADPAGIFATDILPRLP